MNPYREPSKPTNRRLVQRFIDHPRWSVFFAALLIAGIALAATPALRVNGLKFGNNDVDVWVTAYGATGGNSVDDRAAIQSAISACGSGICTVHFPAGNYKITPSSNVGLTVSQPNVRFVGAGPGVTTLTLSAVASSGLISLTGGSPQAGSPYTPAAAAGTASGFQISDMTLVGQLAVGSLPSTFNNPPIAAAIQATGDTSNVVIRNVTFSPGFDIAVYSPFNANLASAHYWQIVGNIFNGLTPTQLNPTLINVPVQIYADNSLIDGNTMTNFAYGVVLGTPGDAAGNFQGLANNKVVNNTINTSVGFDVAIYCSGMKGILIANNHINLPPGGGDGGIINFGDGAIKIGTPAAINTGDVVISGNIIVGGHIKLVDVSNVTIANNVIKSSPSQGIIFDGTTSAQNATAYWNRVSIVGNHFYQGTQQDAIQVANTVGNNVVQLTIANNEIYQPARYGMFLEGIDQLQITGNTIKESGSQTGQAALLWNANHVTATGNTFMGGDVAAGSGFDIKGTTTDATIAGNIVEGYLHAVYIEPSSGTNINISHNLLRGRSTQVGVDSAVYVDTTATAQYILTAFNDIKGYLWVDNGNTNTWMGNLYGTGPTNFALESMIYNGATATGSTAFNLGGSSGAFTLPTGAFSGSPSSVSLTPSGAITLTPGAASTWDTKAGTLRTATLDSTSGTATLQIGGANNTTSTSFFVNNARVAQFAGVVLQPNSDNTGNLGANAVRWGTINAVQHMLGQQTIAAASSITVNPASGTSVRITLSATAITSLTIAAGTAGELMTVEVIEDATGTRTIPTTWTNVLFAGGSYTATVTASKRDVLHFIYDATDSKWVEQSRAMAE